MTYVADRRTAADVMVELARVAERTPAPPSLQGPPGSPLVTWADLLFAGESVQDSSEPSQALLEVLAALHGDRGLLAHFNQLPAAARRWFAQVRLGIQPLPTLADTVVLVVDADPKRTPAVLPKGTAVKAGKDAFDGERVYETTEALTVLGLPVVGAKTWYAPAADELDTVVQVGPKLDPAPVPFAAFGADGAGDAGVHRLYVASELLALGTGSYTVTLSFDGISFPGLGVSSAQVVQDFFKSLVWNLSAPQKVDAKLGQPGASGGPTSVTLTFAVERSSAPAALGGESLYWLSGELGDSATSYNRQLALALSFTDVRLRVSAKKVLPDSGFFNDGPIDVSKEFKPFGPVPRPGDAFGLKSDTAFAKPLEMLEVEFSNTDLGANPKVSWQRFRRGRWEQFAKTSFVEGIQKPKPSQVTDPHSEPTSVGGVVGHSVRIALLSDFGWRSYEESLAGVVNHFVSNSTAPTVTAPPKPPRVGGVQFAYSTKELSRKAGDDVSLYAVNGPSAPEPLESPQVSPFRLDPSGRLGALYVGFGGAPAGEVISLYAEIDEQSVCEAERGEAQVEWRYQAGATWVPLNVVDHTDGLRQSGIVRFAIPDDMRLGSDDLGEATGYWIQATSATPKGGGRIRRLRTDAVEAVYRFGPDWAHDTTPATPLPPETAKQLKVAVPGIKKVANPSESWGGRGPEPADGFARRTSRVLRHRNRAITAWDVETLVAESFPDVGLVRCLPHHSYDSECAPGWFAAVVVPRSLERLPRPSVRLAGLVEGFLHEHATDGTWLAGESHIAILCPKYAEALVSATLVLQPGVQGGEARDRIAADLSEWLRPLGPNPDRSDFGRTLFLSSVVWWLESRSEVAYVKSCAFGGDFAGLDRIDVDGCRGLVASAAAHDLHVEPQL